MAEPPLAFPRELRTAGFVTRAVAFLADLILLVLLLRGAFWVNDLLYAALRTLVRRSLPAHYHLGLLPLVGLAYNVGFLTAFGQTPGKWMMGIRVVSELGVSPRLSQAVIRTLGYLVSALPFYLGFLWVLVDPGRKAWHDHLANTRVVYVREALFSARGPQGTAGRA